ncbi:hypothetical protein BDW72DRAFT_96428 [Aspergillus terricola var. indicus]
MTRDCVAGRSASQIPPWPPAPVDRRTVSERALVCIICFSRRFTQLLHLHVCSLLDSYHRGLTFLNPGLHAALSFLPSLRSPDSLYDVHTLRHSCPAKFLERMMFPSISIPSPLQTRNLRSSVRARLFCYHRTFNHSTVCSSSFRSLHSLGFAGSIAVRRFAVDPRRHKMALCSSGRFFCQP